ncbi:CgeB family protein [Paenibacillus rigui]|uniref:Spore maturation protein n=1 Tax=Paenibacillus rigui TaxID=554312 RepID=A0A229UJ42_9BACL|nr:glycosyltransferase [Paenibacillus rigui]OXM83478.1 spore maturation protein [Paenibacillus rigui]
MRQTRMAGQRMGEAAGGTLGWAHGYHLGRCEAIRLRYKPAAPPCAPVKILYIPQGFHAIDHGIVQALQRLVKELIVGTPRQMLELAKQTRPDIVLVMNGLHVFPADHLQQIDRIRQLGIRTVIWFADDPYFTDDTAVIAPHYDVVITHEQSCVSLYRGLGCREVGYLPLAVDTELFRPRQVEPMYRSDICFIGMGFWNRIAVFDRLARYLAGKRVVLAGGLWDRLAHYKLLRPHIREGWVPIEESVKYYSGAKIVINLHRGFSNEIDNRNSRAIPAQSTNPRTYEIMACGAMQLSDMRADLPALYKPHNEVAVYQSPQELMAKLDYYLTHEEERREIAYNGLRRTLAQHTFLSRIGELLELLGIAKASGVNQ